MKLHVLSDLHLEFSDRHPPWAPPRTEADVVVLAGDIHTGTRAIDWAERTFPNQTVVYVAGNHEHYGSVYEASLDALRERAARSPNVRFLENDETVIDGVRVLGTTLWTDFELFGRPRRQESIEAARRVMVDYRVISVAAGGLFTPEKSLELFEASRAWLERALARDHDGPTVVVTHHGPHPGSVHPRWAEDLASGGFVSDLTPLMGRAALWAHGHTHDGFDYEVAGTRVVANPMGYRTSQWTRNVPEAERHRVRFENAAFDDGRVIPLG